MKQVLSLAAQNCYWQLINNANIQRRLVTLGYRFFSATTTHLQRYNKVINLQLNESLNAQFIKLSTFSVTQSASSFEFCLKAKKK